MCACGHWRFVCVHVVTGGLFVCMWSLEVCLCMQYTVQWRTSNQPVGEVLSNRYLQERSGGTTTSEEIPWRAMEDVFTFLTSDHESREYKPDSGSCSIQ